MTSEDLKCIFGVHNATNYVDYTPLRDKIGFSLQRDYPAHIRYKPPRKKDGMPDTVALIFAFYTPETNQTEAGKRDWTPVELAIKPYPRYLAKYFDYDFNDPNCPTEESVSSSQTTPEPLALKSNGEYFYRQDTDSLFDRAGQRVTGEQILDRLFQQHCDTVQTIRGLKLRWKLAIYKFTSRSIVFVKNVLEWVLAIAFGRILEPEEILEGHFSEYQPETLKLVKTDPLDVFGYKASKNVIITFSILVMIGYLIFEITDKAPEALKKIFHNNLLTICASLILLWILDTLIPRFLFLIINRLIRLRLRTSSKNFDF